MAQHHDDWRTKNQIKGKAVQIDSRPDGHATDWDRSASHWVFTLKREGFGPSEPLVVFYSQGSAHTKPPRTVDVLASLVRDAQGADEPFESWCANYGYDTDSRRAESLYRECQDIAMRLRAFLGDAYESAVDVFADY